MEWFYHCLGTESAAEMLKMPFIIVHQEVAVASLGLHETGSHANCALLWLLEAEKLSTVNKSPCGISEQAIILHLNQSLRAK